MRARPRLVNNTKRPRQHLNVLRGDIVTKMIKAWGHSASYQSRDTRMATEDSSETGSGDDLPQSSIDWLVFQEPASTAEHGENQEYLFMEIEEGPETRDFDYTSTYMRVTEALVLSGEQPTMEDPGEIIANMRAVALTINHRKAVPLTHYFPDEEPLKKELKPGPTLFEAARIDQAITNLDEFL